MNSSAVMSIDGTGKLQSFFPALPIPKDGQAWKMVSKFPASVVQKHYNDAKYQFKPNSFSSSSSISSDVSVLSLADGRKSCWLLGIAIMRQLVTIDWLSLELSTKHPDEKEWQQEMMVRALCNNTADT